MSNTFVSMYDETSKFHARRHPSHNSLIPTISNRSTILYVTVCTEGRKLILTSEEMHRIIVNSWLSTKDWIVGRYIIMPDHIHFFCAPIVFPPCNFRKWMKYWKSLVTKSYWTWREFSEHTGLSPKISTLGKRIHGHQSIFQRDCWDTQMRTGDAYREKCAYVRNNPVRKGLVENADDWPYQGEINVLRWFD